jgi:hypothetical protein
MLINGVKTKTIFVEKHPRKEIQGVINIDIDF